LHFAKKLHIVSPKQFKSLEAFLKIPDFQETGLFQESVITVISIFF